MVERKREREAKPIFMGEKEEDEIRGGGEGRMNLCMEPPSRCIPSRRRARQGRGESSGVGPHSDFAASFGEQEDRGGGVGWGMGWERWSTFGNVPERPRRGIRQLHQKRAYSGPGPRKL